MPAWLYALLCLAVPAVWGVVMFWVFDLWHRRRRREDLRAGPPPIDYSI
ncbi:MAG TPA: hypothetical protein VKW76_02625 [Candidatus Binatia bacterium]|nr:hypothetical protein [Candidatus Binatia bacterium]